RRCSLSIYGEPNELASYRAKKILLRACSVNRSNICWSLASLSFFSTHRSGHRRDPGAVRIFLLALPLRPKLVPSPEPSPTQGARPTRSACSPSGRLSARLTLRRHLRLARQRRQAEPDGHESRPESQHGPAVKRRRPASEFLEEQRGQASADDRRNPFRAVKEAVIGSGIGRAEIV